MNIFEILFFILLVLYILWVISFLFLEKRKPDSMVSWLLIFIIFPFIGFLIYLIFGRDFSKKKIFRLYSNEEKLMIELKKKNLDLYKEKKLNFKKILDDDIDIMELTSIMSATGIYFNNKVKIFNDGRMKFKSLFKDIEEAKIEIYMIYYIYKNDQSGKDLRDLLIKKAKEGVAIKLLLDHMGSYMVSWGFFKELKKAGGEVCFSFPIKLNNLQFNNRNHRKIAIIDRKTAYIGGYNIKDEYIGKNKKMGYWRDTHLRVEGEIIRSLQIRFILDWRNACKDDIIFQPEIIADQVKKGRVTAQILTSGPDSKIEEIKLAYIEMIHKAKEYIYMQSPYFVPDESMIDAIKSALIRGIDVRIMIPNKPDHIFVYWATYSYIGDLLPFGLKAYKYDNGFLHAKTIVVDDKIASVGSANFDRRSFKLSFEANMFLYGKEIGRKMRVIFLHDMKKCVPITLKEYENRPLSVRLKEPISRLISPIL